MLEQQIPIQFPGALIETEISATSYGGTIQEVDQIVADIMSDPDNSDIDTIDGLSPDVWARKEGIIQPYANPRTTKSIRAVVDFYDDVAGQAGRALHGMIDAMLNHEGGEAWRADGTYLGVLEPDPDDVAEWDKEVAKAKLEEAEERKKQERYVNKLPAWELEEWRKRNRIVFQPIPRDYDPSVATYNSTFIVELDSLKNHNKE
jgi:hypothetical protein